LKVLLLAALYGVIAGACVLFPTESYSQGGPSSCSDAAARCTRPRGSGICDAQCQTYCRGEKVACKATGTFRTRNNSWSGLAKR
jgi:hypothetical protein